MEKRVSTLESDLKDARQEIEVVDPLIKAGNFLKQIACSAISFR